MARVYGFFLKYSWSFCISTLLPVGMVETNLVLGVLFHSPKKKEKDNKPFILVHRYENCLKCLLQVFLETKNEKGSW